MSRVIYLIFLTVLAMVLPGCHFVKPSITEGPTIKIAGSTSLLPVSEALAQYYEKKTGVYVNVQGGDSTIGMRGVVNDIVDIGALSRTLTSSEQKELNSYEITTDELSVIIHPQNPVRKLPLTRIRDIFSGEIISWKEFGGPDYDISVIVREEGSGTHSVFKDKIMGDIELTGQAAVVPSTGAVKAAVARDKCAIGYISSNYLSKEVKPLVIMNGKTESHSLTRQLVYITKKEVSSETKAFLNFATGTEAQNYLKSLRN